MTQANVIYVVAGSILKSTHVFHLSKTLNFERERYMMLSVL